MDPDGALPPHPRPGRLRRSAARLLVAGIAAGASLSGGCASSPPPASDRAPPPTSPRAPSAPDTALPRAPEAGPAADLAADGPVTHMGRTVLVRCAKVVVARVESVSDVGTGTETVRIEEEERLAGPEEERPGPYTVFCGSVGLAPRPPGRGLFLLGLLPHGGWATLEVAPLDDADGPARLEAFRRYLGIESIQRPDRRREALLAYLRKALRADDAWTRANAAREYSAFADAFPGKLTPEDGRALAEALPRFREPELRGLAQHALDAVSARAAPAAKGPGTAADPLAPFEERFGAPSAGFAARRDALAEAVAKLDSGAERLVARGLGDPDPVVRAAAAEAAGRTGLASQGPRLLTLAATDRDAEVRGAAVIALGHARVRDAVPTLAGLGRSDAATSRLALFALARIRDDAAMKALEDLGAELRERSGEDAAEAVRLVDFLRSEAFLRQERALGARWVKGL